MADNVPYNQMPPVFEIVIGGHSAESKIVANGHDITRAVRGIKIEQVAGEYAKVTLTVLAAPWNARVVVEGAIKDVAVEDEVPVNG